MTAAGVLASPFPVSAFRPTTLDQAMSRNPHNTSINSHNTSLADDERQQSARCHHISEDGEGELAPNRPKRPFSSPTPSAIHPYQRMPTTGGLMRPQAMTSPAAYPGLYSQQQPRLASAVPGIPRVPLQYAASFNKRNVPFPTR